MIMAAISVDKEIKERPRELYFLIASIFLITALGSMISRTTTTGTAVGLFVLILYSLGGRATETRSMGRIISIFIAFAVIGFSVGVYLYNTDPYYYEVFRFAFEGFFNLVEKGEFTTSSSDILQTMWVWPKDNFGWIIGTGLYDNWVYGSDIGYCRFILYSGLTGFSVFALMFVFLRKKTTFILIVLCPLSHEDRLLYPRHLQLGGDGACPSTQGQLPSRAGA